MAKGTGECGPVTVLIGAFNDENTSLAAKAAMSAAKEHLGGVSSTTINLPVFSTLSKIASSSSGLVVLGSIISQLIPSAERAFAASSQKDTILPVATRVQSLPSDTILAFPNGTK